jgi:hypothetical protein
MSNDSISSSSYENETQKIMSPKPFPWPKFSNEELRKKFNTMSDKQFNRTFNNDDLSSSSSDDEIPKQRIFSNAQPEVIDLLDDSSSSSSSSYSGKRLPHGALNNATTSSATTIGIELKMV